MKLHVSLCLSAAFFLVLYSNFEPSNGQLDFMQNLDGLDLNCSTMTKQIPGGYPQTATQSPLPLPSPSPQQAECAAYICRNICSSRPPSGLKEFQERFDCGSNLFQTFMNRFQRFNETRFVDCVNMLSQANTTTVPTLPPYNNPTPAPTTTTTTTTTVRY